MNIKRMISMSLVLGLLFTFTVLAACSKQEQDNQPTNSSAATDENSTAPAETKGEPIKLVFAKPIWGNKTVDDPSWKPIHDKILEKFNIDLEVVGQQNPGDQAEKPRLMLAAGEQLDFFNVEHWTQFKKDDVILPLNELLDQYGQDLKANALPESWPLRTTADGNIWAVPYEQNPVSNSVLMRKDWLDELGLQVPTTIEEFETVIQAFKDKKNDEGYVAIGQGGLENAFGASFYEAGNSNFLDTDGKIKPYFLDPNFKDFLAKMNEWYKKGYLHKEVATMPSSQAREAFYSGRSCCTLNWLTSLQYNIDAGKIHDPNYNLVGVPPLKGTAAGAYKSDLPYDWGTVISKTSKHPVEAMKLINWMSGTEEGFLLTTYGVEDEQWKWKDKENGVIELIPGKEIEGAGGETNYTTGWLVKLAGKFAMNEVDAPFMKWLNDKSQVNTYYADDFGVLYDYGAMKSDSKAEVLHTMFNEAKWKVIMGNQPVSYWDEFVKDWLDAGGAEQIEDYTGQYNAAKK